MITINPRLINYKMNGTIASLRDKAGKLFSNNILQQLSGKAQEFLKDEKCPSHPDQTTQIDLWIEGDDFRAPGATLASDVVACCCDNFKSTAESKFGEFMDEEKRKRKAE